MISSNLSYRDRNLYTRVCDKSWDRTRPVRKAILAITKATVVSHDSLDEDEKKGMEILIKQHMVVVRSKKDQPSTYEFTLGAKA